MKWVKRLLWTVAGLAAFLLVLRILTPLPSLEGRTESSALAGTHDTPIGRVVTPMAAQHPGRSGIYALEESRDAFAARTLLARAATRSIDAQYYIWHDDLTGSLLFNELKAAADRGVRVRILLDDNNMPGLDPLAAWLDSRPNIEIRLFNPFTIRKLRFLNFLTDFGRLNRRMHNKSFTVDNQATIVGGRNIGDEYFEAGNGAFFLDVDVLAVGAVVPEVSRDFDRYWASDSAFPVDRMVRPPGAAAAERLETRLASVSASSEAEEYVEAVRSLPLVRRLLERDLEMSWVPVRMVSDDPAKGLGRSDEGGLLLSELREAISEPRSSFDLVSAYFVPARQGTAMLTDMAARGVQVSVLTNALQSTDVPIVHAGYAKWRRPLLRAGIRLFELRGIDAAPPPSRGLSTGSSGSRISGAGALHAKTIAADGERAFIGSFNFDPRSANLNTELGFVIESRALAGRMHRMVERFAPARAYEVRLSEDGELYWIERSEDGETRHDVEPGTSAWQRFAVSVVSRLPIEWLL